MRCRYEGIEDRHCSNSVWCDTECSSMRVLFYSAKCYFSCLSFCWLYLNEYSPLSISALTQTLTEMQWVFINLSILGNYNYYFAKSQLIQSRGFICETHDVITEDAYVITIFRIINPRLNDNSRRYPVYFQHGFFQNSDNWLITNVGHLSSDGVYREDNGIVNQCSSNASSVANTLPFVLSSCGYDVWLGNIRGNRYSSHLFLNQDSGIIGKVISNLLSEPRHMIFRNDLLELHYGPIHQIRHRCYHWLRSSGHQPRLFFHVSLK